MRHTPTLAEQLSRSALGRCVAPPGSGTSLGELSSADSGIHHPRPQPQEEQVLSTTPLSRWVIVSQVLCVVGHILLEDCCSSHL